MPFWNLPNFPYIQYFDFGILWVIVLFQRPKFYLPFQLLKNVYTQKSLTTKASKKLPGPKNGKTPQLKLTCCYLPETSRETWGVWRQMPDGQRLRRPWACYLDNPECVHPQKFNIDTIPKMMANMRCVSPFEHGYFGIYIYVKFQKFGSRIVFQTIHLNCEYVSFMVRVDPFLSLDFSATHTADFHKNLVGGVFQLIVWIAKCIGCF